MGAVNQSHSSDNNEGEGEGDGEVMVEMCSYML